MYCREVWTLKQAAVVIVTMMLMIFCLATATGPTPASAVNCQVDTTTVADCKIGLLFGYYKKNWVQFLFVVKGYDLKQHQYYQNFIRKFNAQKRAIAFLSVSSMP